MVHLEAEGIKTYYDQKIIYSRLLGREKVRYNRVAKDQNSRNFLSQNRKCYTCGDHTHSLKKLQETNHSMPKISLFWT